MVRPAVPVPTEPAHTPDHPLQRAHDYPCPETIWLGVDALSIRRDPSDGKALRHLVPGSVPVGCAARAQRGSRNPDPEPLGIGNAL